jgi:hypothetical protein
MTSHNELCNDILELIGKEVIKKREQDTLAYHCDRIEFRPAPPPHSRWSARLPNKRKPTIYAWCPPLPHYPLRYKRSILRHVVDELETEVAFVWGGRVL